MLSLDNPIMAAAKAARMIARSRSHRSGSLPMLLPSRLATWV
jgi:hypothetical protein